MRSAALAYALEPGDAGWGVSVLRVHYYVYTSCTLRAPRTFGGVGEVATARTAGVDTQQLLVQVDWMVGGGWWVVGGGWWVVGGGWWVVGGGWEENLDGL